MLGHLPSWVLESLPIHVMWGPLTQAGRGLSFMERKAEAPRGWWSQEWGGACFRHSEVLLLRLHLLTEASPVTTPRPGGTPPPRPGST